MTILWEFEEKHTKRLELMRRNPIVFGPATLTRQAGRGATVLTILTPLILQNPGKDIVVDVAAGRYQAYAFSPDKLPLFQRGGQASRTCSLHHVVRIRKVEPHGHTNFFLSHAHDAVYIAEYHFKRSIVGHTASHSIGKDRGHRSRDLVSCFERERIGGRAFGDNTHNFRASLHDEEDQGRSCGQGL